MKKIISKVLVIAMIISLFASFSVYANGATASGNQFEIISMSYENEEGALVKAPWSNGKCTVKATLQRIGAEANSAALIGAVYDGGNKMVSADSKGFEYSFPGVKHSYELNFTFPENVEGSVLRLYLWDSVTGLKPIGNGSVFSNISNSAVEKIWIDGNLLPGFDKAVTEYNVELPMSTGDTPSVHAECADLSTKVETSYSDNADGSKKITVTATANSGESTVYVINYTVKQASVSAQLVYDFNNGTEFEYVTEDIALSKRKLLPPEYSRMDMFPCGRLDIDTLGLLIITNDGQTAHKLLSPKRHCKKTYRFECLPLDEKMRSMLEGGIELSDFTSKPCSVKLSDATHGEITVTEGKYHHQNTARILCI